MILRPPFEIGSRLLPELKVGDARVSLECAGVDRDRLAWRWFVDLPTGEFTDCDLRSGCGDTDDARGTQAIFAALLAFLSACGDAWRDEPSLAEGAELFPPEVGRWARQCQDEIDSLRCLLDETPGLLEDGE